MPNKIVLIGASTGGPGQIEKIISSLEPLSNTTIIIAQHMAVGFIPSFAKRLKEHSVNPVDVAVNNQAVENGHIYLCRGFTSFTKNNTQLYFSVGPAIEYKYNPDINTISESLANFSKDIEILCVILTGIGGDGVDGCKQLSLNGARTLTETQESAIVDGMPSRARKEVPNIEISDMLGIIKKIKDFCN